MFLKVIIKYMIIRENKMFAKDLMPNSTRYCIIYITDFSFVIGAILGNIIWKFEILKLF